MKTYCPWPSRINAISITKKTANVHFFGTNQIGTVPLKDIVSFGECTDVILLLLERKKEDFILAVHEAEKEAGVPESLSLLNSKKGN